MTNWQEPQKQSAFGIFLFAGKALREMIAVVLIIIGSMMRGKDKPWYAYALIFGALGLFVFVKALLDYYYFTFHVEEGQLVIRKGLFSKKHVLIPLERIQTVQLHQNLFHKLILHCKVSIDTAGTNETEVAIQALSLQKALSLKQVLTQQTVRPAPELEATKEKKIIRLQPADLFKIALSANHLETFGLIAAFVLARFEDVKDLLGINALDWVEEKGKEVTLTAETIGIITFFALGFAILISVLRIILRFSDLTIHLDDKGFHLKHGLLSSQQQFVGARKIQYIKWNANWIRRKIGMNMFHIKTAGEDEVKKKQRIHMPVTRTEHLKELSAYYQEQPPSEHTDAGGIQPEFVYRRVLLFALPFTLAVTAIAFVWWKWWSLLLMSWLVYYTITIAIYRLNFRIWVNDDAIEISRGVWGRQHVLVNWYKVQVVTLRQGMYQRRKGLASLCLHTAAGDIDIPFLREGEATMLADYATMKIEHTQQNWM